MLDSNAEDIFRQVRLKITNSVSLPLVFEEVSDGCKRKEALLQCYICSFESLQQITMTRLPQNLIQTIDERSESLMIDFLAYYRIVNT